MDMERKFDLNLPWKSNEKTPNTARSYAEASKKPRRRAGHDVVHSLQNDKEALKEAL